MKLKPATPSTLTAPSAVPALEADALRGDTLTPAQRRRYHRLLDRLLTARAPVFDEDLEGWSGIGAAASTGRLDVLRRLLANGTLARASTSLQAVERDLARMSLLLALRHDQLEAMRILAPYAMPGETPDPFFFECVPNDTVAVAHKNEALDILAAMAAHDPERFTARVSAFSAGASDIILFETLRRHPHLAAPRNFSETRQAAARRMAGFAARWRQSAGFLPHADLLEVDPAGCDAATYAAVFAMLRPQSLAGEAAALSYAAARLFGDVDSVLDFLALKGKPGKNPLRDALCEAIGQTKAQEILIEVMDLGHPSRRTPTRRRGRTLLAAPRP